MEAEFTALGKAMAGGSGWALLSWSEREAKLINQWAADHAHLLVGATPVLALDMYEHAYHLDFGAQADAYVDAFMNGIHWPSVEQAYSAAVIASTSTLSIEARSAWSVPGARFIDVRRAGAFIAAEDLVQGATWYDPAEIGKWATTLDSGRSAVVYCVHGHAVSRSVAKALQAIGIDAKFIEGGFQAWKSAGLPTQPKMSSVRPTGGASAA